eukprot:8990903-Pyramimonas_sp.AAC.1
MKQGDGGSFEQVCGVSGPLLGPRQTAPRAEIAAPAMALEEAAGPIGYATYCQPVLDASGAGRARGRLGPNRNLWHR